MSKRIWSKANWSLSNQLAAAGVAIGVIGLGFMVFADIDSSTLVDNTRRIADAVEAQVEKGAQDSFEESASDSASAIGGISITSSEVGDSFNSSSASGTRSGADAAAAAGIMIESSRVTGSFNTESRADDSGARGSAAGEVNGRN